MAQLEKRLMGVAVAVVLAWYHVSNALFLAGRLGPRGECGYRRVGIGGFRWSIAKHCDSGGSDYSTTAIRSLGYIARFLLGETNSLIAPAGRTPAGDLSLFLRNEWGFHFPDRAEPVRRDLAPRLRRVREALTSRGVEVVLLPIPPKRAVEREQVPARRPEAEIFESIPSVRPTELDPAEPYRWVLDSDPGHTVDLLSAFRSAYVDNRGQSPFIPWGYHWSSYGIALGVGGVVGKLKELGWPIQSWRTRQVEVSDHYAPERFLSTFQLPPWFIRSRPEFSWREPYFVVDVDGHPKADCRRIYFVADSNGAQLVQEGYYFAKVLERALGVPVVDRTKSGVSVGESLASLGPEGVVFEPGDLLVIEFQVPSLFLPGHEAGLRLEVKGSSRSLSGQ